MPPEAFVIPLDFHRDERRFQKAYRHKKDRKASHDAKPRIRRSIAGLEPAEGVFLGGTIVAAVSGIQPMQADFAEAVISCMAAARACAFLTERN